ncbi:transcriptional regulator, partial [Streptomyces sp. MCAF7]
VEIVLCPIPSNPVSLGAATFALEGSLATMKSKHHRTPAAGGGRGSAS